MAIFAEPITAPDPKQSCDFSKLVANATLILLDKSVGNSAWAR